MEYQKAVNKSLALVLWATDDDGEDDVVVCSGVFVKDGEGHVLERKEGKNLEIREEWLERIKVVPADVKETLMNCEYQLSLIVGDVPEDTTGFEDFGLKWPD